MHFLLGVLHMTTIALASVINHYHINGLHLFWDTLYFTEVVIDKRRKVSSVLNDLPLTIDFILSACRGNLCFTHLSSLFFSSALYPALSLSLSLSLSLTHTHSLSLFLVGYSIRIYIYIYIKREREMRACVCVAVCVRVYISQPHWLSTRVGNLPAATYAEMQ